MTEFPLAIVAAMEDEIRDLRPRLVVDEDLRLSPGRLTVGTWEGRPLLLLRAGIGTAVTAVNLRLLLERFAPRFALQVGYAGGTVPELRAGHLVIATALIDSERSLTFPAAPEVVTQADSLRRRLGLPGACGPLVTVAAPVLTPAAKAAIGLKHQAPALEMESAIFAEVCGATGLPFLVVRTILDPVDFSLEYLFPPPGQAPRPRGPHPFRLPPLKDLADQARLRLMSFTTAWLQDFFH